MSLAMRAASTPQRPSQLRRPYDASDLSDPFAGEDPDVVEASSSACAPGAAECAGFARADAAFAAAGFPAKNFEDSAGLAEPFDPFGAAFEACCGRPPRFSRHSAIPPSKPSSLLIVLTFAGSLNVTSRLFPPPIK